MKSSLAPRHGRLFRRMAADAAALRPRPGLGADTPVTPAALAGLPAAAQRFLTFMEVTGRPPDRSFTAHFTGRFRLRPRLPWLRFTPGAARYNVSPAELSPREQDRQLPGDDLIPGPVAAAGSRP